MSECEDAGPRNAMMGREIMMGREPKPLVFARKKQLHELAVKLAAEIENAIVDDRERHFVISAIQHMCGR